MLDSSLASSTTVMQIKRKDSNVSDETIVEMKGTKEEEPANKE